MSAAEQNDEQEIGKTDPDPQRLIEAVMDKLDGVLFKQGFEFREDKDWTEAGSKIMEWIFEYYDDLTGGDTDYQPGDSASNGEEEEEEESDDDDGSRSLGSSSEDDSPPKKKQK